MAGPLLLLAVDLHDHADRWLAGHSISAQQDSIRGAIQSAYLEIGTAFNWSFLYQHGRIHLAAPYSTGTVTYTHSTRTLTLSGGTWPTDAADYTVRVDDVICLVASRDSDTQLTLDSTMNPGADVVAGATYSIYPSYYRLPNDFASVVIPRSEEYHWNLDAVSYDEIMSLDRHDHTTGTPQKYCVRAVEDLLGQMAIYLYPVADAASTLDFIYRRRPRDIRFMGANAADYQGTVAVTAGSAVVTGTGTAFSSLVPGAVMRIGTSATLRPTDKYGTAPWVEERSIATRTSTTILSLDAAVSQNQTGVKYVISDPVDMDATLHNVMRAGMIWHLAQERGVELPAGLFNGQRVTEYERALLIARSADSRIGGRRVCGGRGAWPIRLADRISTYQAES
jgi:hypothetical protein